MAPSDAGERVRDGAPPDVGSGPMGASRSRPPARRRRGRPAVLDLDRIVRAALSVSQEAGADSLTMSAVAQRLGVAQPALYYHVENLDELLRLVAEELLRRIELPEPRLRWDRWLVAFSHALRRLLIHQPLLTRLRYLAVHPPFPAESIEGALRVLTRDGFAPDYALVMFGQHARVVIDLVHAEQAREHERRVDRSPITELRRIAARAPTGSTPILDTVLERFAGIPDDRHGYDDVLFEWQLGLEIAGWRAVLAGELPPTLLGPPRPVGDRDGGALR